MKIKELQTLVDKIECFGGYSIKRNHFGRYTVLKDGVYIRDYCSLILAFMKVRRELRQYEQTGT